MRSPTRIKLICTRILAVVLALSFGSAFAACKKKSKVPSKEDFLASGLNGQDPLDIREYEFDRTDLFDAWGNPDIDKYMSYMAVWSCGEKFIIAEFDPDLPNKITMLYASFTQDIVVLFSYATIVYVSPRNGDTTEYSRWVMLPDKWFSENDLAKIQPGTILQMEFGGSFMESYPEQINEPFSLKIIGNVPDTELPKLQEQAQLVRDFCIHEE